MHHLLVYLNIVQFKHKCLLSGDIYMSQHKLALVCKCVDPKYLHLPTARGNRCTRSHIEPTDEAHVSLFILSKKQKNPIKLQIAKHYANNMRLS